MRTITPTRHNLHRIEARIEFAQRGHDVLERKLEGLIFEFMDVFDQYVSTRRSIASTYERAQHELDLVRAIEGDVKLHGIARTRKLHPTVSVSLKNIMGVHVPQIEPSGIESSLPERGYGLLGTDTVVDELVDVYEDLLEEVVVLAEIEAFMYVVLDEIGTTRRRVNVLEDVLLPRLRGDATTIRHRLAEHERDERVRQKWFKIHKGRGRHLGQDDGTSR